MSDKTPRINALDSNAVKLSYVAAPFTTVVNRAFVVDLANDLSAHGGVNRIMVQDIFEIQGEKGPNNQKVYGAINDRFNQIRYVGDVTVFNNSNGQFVNFNNENDFVEYTFYGTGLNLLTALNDPTADFRASIDGGGEGGNLVVGSPSTVLTGRNYSHNQVLKIASGLSLGIHTVKIRNAAVANSFTVYGFEAFNESNSIRINPGTLANGKTLLAHTSGFKTGLDVETGTDVGAGGAVLYYEQDGSIKKAMNWAEDNQLNLGAADHSNEEEITRFHPREFGAGRADDFSTVPATGNNIRAFTLDDGTTTLVGDGYSITSTSIPKESLRATDATAAITLTFVGTGLDIVRQDTSAVTASYNDYLIDGSSVGAPSTSAFNGKVEKIVSGLPYGTHTFNLTLTSGGFTIDISDFIVYGPKKPTLPSGAVPLHTYNLMADYVENTTQNTASVGYEGFISQGVINKSNIRELVYSDSNWIANLNIFRPSGIDMQNLAGPTTAYAEYTFWGTGFEYIFTTASVNPETVQMTLDGGTNFSGFTTSTLGTGVSFTPATGILDTRDPVTVTNNHLSVTGLTLGLHTVKIEKGSGGGNEFIIDAIRVITPIHVPKLNGPIVIQNALRVGSQGIGDLRKFSEDQVVNKAKWTKALAISAPSTSSTSPVPMEDMFVPIEIENDGALEIQLTTTLRKVSGGTVITRLYIYLDGVLIPKSTTHENLTTSDHVSVNMHTIAPVSKGTHIVQVFWNVDGAQVVDDANASRTLTVREIKG